MTYLWQANTAPGEHTRGSESQADVVFQSSLKLHFGFDSLNSKAPFIAEEITIKIEKHVNGGGRNRLSGFLLSRFLSVVLTSLQSV